ncbi:MAG: hypothetical protein AAGF28_01780 [Pseudomonadota bacterium]
MTQPGLQNRVHPNGDIIANSARGTVMGNRGGQIHDAATQTLHPTKRWASRQWICCVTEFKNRQRKVMSDGTYTELFFLDEVTALAAGHRPCFECRRTAANAFGEAWARAHGLARRPSAPDMDKVLHEERLLDRKKRTHVAAWDTLPVGTIVVDGKGVIAKSDHGALHWSFGGYAPSPTRHGDVEVLTPPTILAVLHAGYQPLWHPSANMN